ncbi:Cytosolic sulfotransferase 5 [Striga hermonthica]|uniref:Sulfotransferase n=1 Tax=Striga hermonthica TaxID=68872 RepID=A0A9N7NBY1_STRHE|nr:Cytosolic sulfotransferase 5 [Striga hermonthica]
MPSEMSPPEYLQDEESLTAEIRNTISRLPKEKGWLAAHLYRYEGFWYPARYLQGVVACQTHFRPLPTDILLVTTPKSGTTWLKALVFTLANRANHPPSSSSNHPLSSASPHQLVPFLEISLFVNGQAPDPSSFPSHPRRILATHLPLSSLPYCSNGGKVVYLCRDPKDVFVSLWHFTNALKPKGSTPTPVRDVLHMFCRGVSLFGPFWDHVLAYWYKSRDTPDTFLFLRYEELKESPGPVLRRLADFLGCPFTHDEEAAGLVDSILEMCSFDSLSGLQVNKTGKLSSGEENRTFFRRGVVGDWENYLGPEMAHTIDRITQEKFRGSGLLM